MAAPKFSTAQQTVADMIDLAKAVEGSALASVTVVQEVLGVDLAQTVDPVLRDDGAAILVLFPESGGVAAERETNFYYVNVVAILIVNPRTLPDGIGETLGAMMDDLLGAPTLYAQTNLGPAYPKPLEVPVERIDEAVGWVAYALHYTIPVLL